VRQGTSEHTFWVHIPFRLGFSACTSGESLDGLIKRIKQKFPRASINRRQSPSIFCRSFNAELDLGEIIKISGFNVSVRFLGFGLGYLSAQRALSETELSLSKITDLSDTLWDHASNEFSKPTKLGDCIRALQYPDRSFSLDNSMLCTMNQPALMESFSQTIVTNSASSDFSKELFGSVLTESTHESGDGEFVCTPSVNYLRLHEVAEGNWEEIVSAAAINMATLYNIQNFNLSLSRKLLDDETSRCNIDKNIDFFELFIGVQNQLVEEIKCEDFLGTFEEEWIGRPLLKAWSVDALVYSAGAAIEHLGRQVEKAKYRVLRKNQKRQSIFFLFFTVLTVVSVTADILGIYDFKNELSSEIRLAFVLGIFSCALLWAFSVIKEEN